MCDPCDPYEISLMIRNAARMRQMSLKELAEKSGIGRNFMAHLTNGKVISTINLVKIADTLNVSVDFLLGRTDKPEINK